jgi:hypothetical protein
VKYTWRKWSWSILRNPSLFLWHSQRGCLFVASFRASLTNLWWKFWSANTIRFFPHYNKKHIKVLHKVSEVAVCFSSRFWYWVGFSDICSSTDSSVPPDIWCTVSFLVQNMVAFCELYIFTLLLVVHIDPSLHSTIQFAYYLCMWFFGMKQDWRKFKWIPLLVLISLC